MAFLRQHSKNLYVMDEIYSALQKSIRRNLVSEALFWGGELVNSGNPNPLWNRLFVIISEDIGIANPQTARVVYSHYEKWKSILKTAKIIEKESFKSSKAVAEVIMAIKYMCGLQKSNYGHNFGIFAVKTDTRLTFRPNSILNRC